MKIIVSGKTKDFTPELQEKFNAKLAKLSKFVERRGEREAHVTHHVERHRHRIEVILNFYDHSLVSEGADPDLDTALCQAVDKLEKQVLKLRTRWRDTHRDPKGVRSTKESWDGAAGALAAPPEPAALPVASSAAGKLNGRPAKRPKIYHVNYNEDRKPMTLQEAMLEMQRDSDDYVVYRDSTRNCLSVLVRRPDGNFDLIES